MKSIFHFLTPIFYFISIFSFLNKKRENMLSCFKNFKIFLEVVKNTRKLGGGNAAECGWRPQENWNWIGSTGLLGFIILFRCSGYLLAHVPKPEVYVSFWQSFKVEYTIFSFIL